MGLILKPSEMKSAIGQMRTGLQGMAESYAGALQVIQEFSQNMELQSKSWDTIKSNIYEAHQAIVNGTICLHNMVETDLGQLENSIGNENLDEDQLLLEIERLEEECSHYEEVINKLTYMKNNSVFDGDTMSGISRLIYYNEILLSKAEITLEILKGKLQSLYEISSTTAILFNASEALIQAIEYAINDAGVFITGEGVPSDGTWKNTIANYVMEIKAKQLSIEGYLDNELGISYEEFKKMYGEEVINEIKICLDEYKGQELDNSKKEQINIDILKIVCDCSYVSYKDGRYQLLSSSKEVMCEFSQEEMKEKIMNIAYANKEIKKDYIYNYLKENLDISDMHIAAIMGNMQIESGFSPLISQKKFTNLYNTEYMERYINGETRDTSGWGLIQWSEASRKEGLLNYAEKEKGEGAFFGDMDTQLEYLVYELEEGVCKYSYGKFLEEDSLEGATDYFCTYIEIAGDSHMDRRIEAAKMIYDNLGKN